MKKRAFLFLAVAAVVLAIACETLVLERTAPKTAEDYQVRGLEYLNNGDYDSAIAEFTQAINLNPDYAEAYSKRGNAYFERGNAYFDRYMAYGNEDDWDSAIADWDQSSADWNWSFYIRAILRNPNDAEAYYWRGLAYYWRGLAYHDKKEYDLAIMDFTYAIHLNSIDECAYIGRGMAYDKKKDYDKAIADYEAALQLLDPDDFLAEIIRDNLENARQLGSY